MNNNECLPCGAELNFLASAIAAIISKGLEKDDIVLLGIFLTALGDMISVIGVAMDTDYCKKPIDTCNSN